MGRVGRHEGRVFTRGWDIPNLVVAKVGANGSVTVYNNQGSTHVIFDVVGYFPG